MFVMKRKYSKWMSLLLAVVLLVPTGLLGASVQAETEQASTIYHETFANGKGIAGQSGGASLTPVTDKVFAGNDDGAALYVSNRQNNYDAADFSFESMGLVDGETYQVTVSLYVDEDVEVPADAQAFLQTVNSYGWLGGKAYIAGEAMTITGNLVVDKSKDSALRIQSNDPGATVPFYIGDILITGEADEEIEPEPSRPPALPFTTITFEDQALGGFEGRSGDETLTITDEANHTEDGSYSLKVEGRASTWHGPSLRVEQYVDKGYEYTISAWVKLIEPASSQLQLSTQVGNGGSANYIQLAPKTISTNDGWVLFEGNYRYNNVSSEYLTIYIESSNNANASFYIDDISFTRTGSGPVTIEKDLMPIKDVYESDFLIGSAISSEDLEGVRLELLAMHHNVATAGNAMKPDALQPTKGNFTFSNADSLVNAVLDEEMAVHGHVLVWHQQSPAWMNTTTNETGNTVPLSREEALSNLQTHIRTVMEHFEDRVIAWDVVNEAMNDNPSNPSDWEGALRQSAWYQAIGPDYVEQAFLAAREVLDENPDWDIKLYYNDYNEDNQNKAEAIYQMTKEINDRYAAANNGKLLIDGIGMQGHYNINTNPANVELSLEKFISLGVEVSITELDIQAGSNFELSEKLANEQGYLYAQLFTLFKEHADHIARVTLWGLDDSTSWRAANNPLLFDKNLKAKPAYYAVIDPEGFIEDHEPEVIEANQATANYGTPTIDGTIDAIWSQAQQIAVNRYQTAWQGATGVAKALWDDENLYVLVQVSDSQLDKSNSNAWEQDSVEVFLDQNNGKTTFYQADDGQYRINFENETSFNPVSIEQGFESATTVDGTNYIVELKIPLTEVTPSDNTKLGFDIQINDANNGARQSVAAWNDTTGTGYMDTSVYGELTLTGKNVAPPVNNNNNSETVTPASNIIRPQVTNENHGVVGSISQEQLLTALVHSTAGANGKKQVIIDVTGQAGANSFEIKLPIQGSQNQEQYTIKIKTVQGTMDIPSSILANSNASGSTGQISIVIAKASANEWNEAGQTKIGTRPVVQFNVLVNGQSITGGSSSNAITVSIPYTLSNNEPNNTDSVVLWGLDSNGNAVVIPNSRYDAATKSVLFETNELGTFAVAYVEHAFQDIANVPWANQAISAMFARDIINGKTENSFAPQQSITRADFITLLVRALQLQAVNNTDVEMFEDIHESAYYYNELLIAKQLGIVNGLENNTFQPLSDISRQDMMVLTVRALAAAGIKLDASNSLDAFADASEIADYAKNQVALLVQAGIINGKNGEIAPLDSLTRAEVAVILYRIWKL